MQKKYQPPLLLDVNYSQRLMWVMGFIHALALAANVMNSLPVLVKCALFCAVSCHYYFQRKQLKKQQYSVKHTEALGWERSANGKFEPVQILPSTVISIFAIFLHLKIDNKSRHNLVIFSDSLAEDDYRRLIVRLKTTLSEQENQ